MFGLVGSPAPNPYSLTDYIAADYTSTAGRVSVSSALVGGENTGVFVYIGQSLGCNIAPTAFTPASTKCQQMNHYDGTVYQLKDPMIGTNGAVGGCVVGRIGDKLISGGKFARVIFDNISVGGTTVKDWSPLGIYNHRLMVAIKRLRAAGLPITGFLYQQGQSDAWAAIGSTTRTGDSAGWQALFAQVKATADGLGYSSVPWFVAVDTMYLSVTEPTIAGAQAAVVNGSTIYAGPNIDSGVPAGQRSDGTHPNDTGMDTMAGLWNTVITAHSF